MFSVEILECGVIVRGEVPVQDLSSVAKIGEDRGFNLVDAAISGALRATLVLTNKRHGSKWRAEIQTRQDAVLRDPHVALVEKIGLFLGNAFEQYIDAGLSSKTLLRILSGRMRPLEEVHLPQDASDFGRCVRMLALFPLYAELFPQFTMPTPEWVVLQSNWDRLTELYASGQPAVLGAELHAQYKRG